ncbi:MAG: BTAD domain-containing putative transcriptional regulator [Caldilineaceae bacterium]
MASLQITCLGNFQLTLDDAAPTTFLTDKTRALLVYLALEPQEHQRSRLTQIFWSGYSEESARNNLRQTLHLLRQFLAGEESTPWLLVTRQTVQINPAASINSDVTTFTGLLAAVASHSHAEVATCPACLAQLRQAVDLYHGDFLTGFSAIDSVGFEEWRRLTEEQLHLQMLNSLAQLAHAAERAADLDGALQTAQRQLTLEPWLETAHRQIMRLLAQRGQRAAALAQYNRCRQVLAEELGVEPDAETTALYEQIQRGAFDKETRRQRDKETGRQGDRETSDRETSDRETSDKVNQEHLVTPSPPPLVTPPPSHNLPAALTPFVGGVQTVAELCTRLQTQEARLLTLLGPGGVGKTRLALAVGQALVDARVYRDGVFFVALASLADPAMVAATIATALELNLPGDDADVRLRQTLRAKQMLLILDNFEQLLPTVATASPSRAAVALVSELLQAAPGVQILATSRERLNLHGESLYSVESMSFAPQATLAQALTAPAVQLFVQSARRVQPHFTVHETNLSALLRICALVQGMPLGLEMAAAWVDQLALAEIAHEIEQSVDFLALEGHDVPARQQSLRAVFAWSWRLLSPAEQQAWRQLSIFRGGFTRHAAEKVTGLSLRVLTSLVYKSLLRYRDGYYDLHELLRQLAEEQLQAVAEEYAAVATRHSDYYLAFVAAQEQRIAGAELRQAADTIQPEINNIRQAWRWAATQTNIDALGAAAYALWQFYEMRGLRAEAEQMLRLAAAIGARPPSAELADQSLLQNRQRSLSKLLALHANMLVAQGKYADAAAIARQAMALGQRYNSPEGESYGTAVLGQALTHMNHFADARAVAAEALHLVQHYTSDTATSALLDQAAWLTYENLGFLTFEAGDYPGARAYMGQSLQRAQARGQQRQEQVCLYYLAQYAGNVGNYATALPEYEQCLALMRAHRDQLGEIYALVGVGQACRLQGAYTRAQTALAQALALAHQLGDVFCQITALADLSRLHCLLGNASAVGPWLTQLNQLLAQRELNPGRRLYGLDLLAFHALTVGNGPQALTYAEEAAQMAQGYIGYGQAQALVTLGQARAYNQQWAAAQVAYQQAVDGYAKLNNARLAVEPRAGLAQLALAQGDLAQAQAWVESILPVLTAEPRAGFNSPFFAYFICQRVLVAAADPRAVALLQSAHDLLHQTAAAIDDEALRRAFLDKVAIHQALQQVYAALPAQG